MDAEMGRVSPTEFPELHEHECECDDDLERSE